MHGSDALNTGIILGKKGAVSPEMADISTVMTHSRKFGLRSTSTVGRAGETMMATPFSSLHR